MPNYNEIARLKQSGKSNRFIADVLGISRNTVNLIVKRMEDSGQSYSQLMDFSEDKLKELMSYPSSKQNNRKLLIRKNIFPGTKGTGFYY